MKCLLASSDSGKGNTSFEIIGELRFWVICRMELNIGDNEGTLCSVW